MTKEQQIERIKARLKKAYSLPLSEQIKWKKQIQELGQELARLQGSVSFDENRAVNLLILANKEILKNCTERRYGEGFCQFLRENVEVQCYWDEAMQAVNVAFRQKNMDEFVKAIEQYKSAFIKIEELYQQSKTTGFRELLPSEEKDFQLSIFN